MLYKKEIEKYLKVSNSFLKEFEKLDKELNVISTFKNPMDGFTYYSLVYDRDKARFIEKYKEIKNYKILLNSLKVHNMNFLKDKSTIEKQLNLTGLFNIKIDGIYPNTAKHPKFKVKPFLFKNQTVLSFYKELSVWFYTVSSVADKL